MEPPIMECTFRPKRRADATPSDNINEPVQKARRITSSNDNDDDDQHPNRQRKQTPPPTKTLPPEIWMQILESIDHSHHFARPAYVNCFISAIISKRSTEADLVAELPAFEKEAWKATRPYYAINRTSRQAAHQCFLSGVLLQTTTSPLNNVPIKRNRGRRDPHTPRTSIPPPFYPSSALARMRPQIVSNHETTLTALTISTAPVPTYLPLELFDFRLFRQAAVLNTSPNAPDARFQPALLGHMAELFDQHYKALVRPDVTLLRSVRRVDLLAAAPWEHLTKPARVWAEIVAKGIETVWARLGVEDGVVRVLE